MLKFQLSVFLCRIARVTFLPPSFHLVSLIGKTGGTKLPEAGALPMRKMASAQKSLKRNALLILPFTLIVSFVQVVYSPSASATAPRAASLIGRTGGELINYTGNVACKKTPRGITNDGTFIYFRTLTAGTQTICKVTLAGVYVSHAVIGDSAINGDGRDLAYSRGCLLIPDNTDNTTGLKCILASDLSTIQALTIPSGFPMLQKTSGWMIRNIADLPDGRIGFMGEPATSTGNGYPNANGIACPAGKFCKVFRTYNVTGTAPSLSLQFSRDYVLVDESASWPGDEHGIASDGTYLYEIRHLGGYRVWTLTDSGTSPMAFNGHTAATSSDLPAKASFIVVNNDACLASSGTNSNCSIRSPQPGVTLINVTFMTHNHETNRYILGDYDADLTPASPALFYMTPGVQEITFSAISTKTFGDSSFSMDASNKSASGATLTYTSQTGSVCSVSVQTVTILGAGTCTIRASVTATATYDAAQSDQSFTVNRAPQLGFTLSSTSGTYLTNLRLLTSGGSDTGTVSFAVSNVGTAGCSVANSDSLTSTTAGTCQIVATKLGTSNYLPAYDTQTVTLGKASLQLTISVSGSSTIKYGGAATSSFTTNRVLGSGGVAARTGTISYSASGSACAINSSTGAVSMIRASGTCSVQVSLANDPNYSDTSSVTVTLTAAKADAITVTAAAKTSVFTGSASTITPTYSVSGLQFSDTVTVTYGYTGSTNGGDLYSFVTDKPSLAGTYSIIPMVTQSNSDSYTASATINSGALTISRATRTLSPSTYSKLTLKYGESATVTLNTTSPSTNNDGEFSYSVGSGCSIDSGSGTVTAANYQGTCSSTTTIQQGNNYESATATAVSFSLSKADTITVTASSPSAVTYTGSAAAVTPTVSVSGLVAGNSSTGATFNYSRAPSCAAGGNCQVGDVGPGGGKVFYVSGTAINSVSGISTGGIYLEMAPSTFSKTTYNWCEGSGNPYTTLFGATATTIGSGAANTKIMIDNCTGGAGVQAANLTLGGKSDWFLPSYNELVEIYNLRTMLGLGTGKYASTYLYWSSTEAENWIASSLVPWAGVGGQNKADATPYLPIRAFSPTSSTYESPISSPTNAGTYRITPSALTLSGGITTSYYVATVYETGTLTINRAAQAAFTNYSTLSGVLGITLPIVKFGGSGDGAESIETANGSATGCALSGTLLSATAAGTCSVSATKDLSENYTQYDSVFAVNFEYYVPAPAPPVSTTPTQIAVEAKNNWSVNASVGPTITGISPSSGPVGTVVTITGTGMNGVDVIKIGRRSLTSVTGVSETSVTGVIPAGASSGPIFVSNSLGSHFFPSGFTVMAP